MAPREMLDTEVRQAGFFRADTMEILSATVGSLGVGPAGGTLAG